MRELVVAIMVVAALAGPAARAQTSAGIESDAWPSFSSIDETRVVVPDRVPHFVERFAYRHDATIADLLAEAHLKLVDDSIGIWLQRSETGASVLALGVEPIGDGGTRTLLLIVSVDGSDYPILTDAPLGNGSLRLELLGTNEAVAVRPAGSGGLETVRTAAFDPVARNETGNQLRAVRSDGLSETLSCLVSTLLGNAGWSDIICAISDYTICVAGSAGAGFVSCAVAFKQLLPGCSSSLSGLTTCFGIASDTSAPSITITKPGSGSTVSGTAPITASISDNALKAVTVQVEYQGSSARKIALVANSDPVGGCSVSSSSGTCSTQFNFGQAVNGSSATVRVTAVDTAGNIGNSSRTVTVSTGPLTYSISGNAGQGGVGISGCSQSTQTDASGNYRLDGCTAGTYVITPGKSGCSFSPASRSITVGPSATGVNFAPSCGMVTLANGQILTSLSGGTGTWRSFKIVVPAGQSQLKITMSGGTGDADLYVRRGGAPTLSLWDYRPFLSGNSEIVTVTSPASGDWYIGIYAYASYSGLSLTAAYGSACTSYSGSLPGTGYVYYIPSSSGYTTASSGSHVGKLTGAGVDFDLYLQKYLSSTWTTVAQSTASGSTETVSYSGTAGTYRWRVYSYSGSGAFTLCVARP